jgi:hypothetical protein
MIPRRMLQVGAMAWGVVGAMIAIASLRSVNPGARLLVATFAVACPVAAVLAAPALAGHRDQVAGLLLVISCATPTYFFWIVNLPALVVGLALLVAPAMVVRGTPVASVRASG